MEHQIELIKIERLTPYARNSRKHSDEQITQIAASIKEFGFTNPLLITDDDTIIAGHGRFAAAKKLGLDLVPCIRLKHLSKTQARALVLADNQIALNASWDFDMLAVEIDELNDAKYDISRIGFSNEELADLIGTPEMPPVPGGDGESEKKPVVCPSCKHQFVPN